jgi:hypothetical protein
MLKPGMLLIIAPTIGLTLVLTVVLTIVPTTTVRVTPRPIALRMTARIIINISPRGPLR